MKMSCQPRPNRVKDEKVDLFAGSRIFFLGRGRYRFSYLLNVHGVNDVRQTEIQTAEPLVPESSAFAVEMAIEKLKRHKSPSTDQIPTALVRALGRSMHSGIHKLINSIWNNEKLPDEWKGSIVVPIQKKGDKQITVIIL